MSAVGMRMLQALTAAVLVAILTGCSSVIIDVTRFNVFTKVRTRGSNFAFANGTGSIEEAVYRGLIGSSLEKLGWQQTERSRAKVGFYRLTPRA